MVIVGIVAAIKYFGSRRDEADDDIQGDHPYGAGWFLRQSQPIYMIARLAQAEGVYELAAGPRVTLVSSGRGPGRGVATRSCNARGGATTGDDAPVITGNTQDGETNKP